MKPARLLILGAGAVVREYYLPVLRTLGSVPNVTVIDVSSSALRELRDRFPEVRTQEADFRHLLKESLVQDSWQAVIVALPNSLHEEAVLLALDGGLHVLCEKPLVLTQEACLRLAAYAEQRNRVLGVNMVRRLLPSVLALRDALRRGLIGELSGIDVEDGNPYAWPSDSGAFFQRENGGVLVDMGVHYLDLVEICAGELIPLRYEDDSCGGVEANALFHLKSRGGTPVRLKLSYTRQLRNTAIFSGSHGELVIEKDGFDGCLWRPSENGRITKLRPTKPFSGGDWPPTLESCFAQQVLDFSLFLRQGEPTPVTARHVAPTVGLLEWAYRQRQEAPDLRRMEGAAASAPLPPAPVFVTGGTGFIGSNLVKKLYELGFDPITVPVRTYSTCAEVARFPVRLPRVDLLDSTQVKSAMKGARWVFHCAYGRDGPLAARMTVEGTQNVVEAAIALGCEGVVILSSVAVFGYPRDAVVDEAWTYRPTLGEYDGRSKARMERWCLQRAKTSGSTRIVVLNPSCVYGPGDHTYSVMPPRMAEEGTFCWIEQGRGTANYTYVDNLVDAMLMAAGCRQAHGQRFIINDGTTTWRNLLSPFLGRYRDSITSYTKRQLVDLHRRAPRRNLKDLVRILASEQKVIDVLKGMWGVSAVIQLAQRLTPGCLEQIRRWRWSQRERAQRPNTNHATAPLRLTELFGPIATQFSSEKARRVLHWEPRIDLPEGQRLTVGWLQSANLFRGSL